jgi:hypothetical protein
MSRNPFSTTPTNFEAPFSESKVIYDRLHLVYRATLRGIEAIGEISEPAQVATTKTETAWQAAANSTATATGKVSFGHALQEDRAAAARFDIDQIYGYGEASQPSADVAAEQIMNAERQDDSHEYPLAA